MRRLPRAKRAEILAMLADGNSVAGTVRLSGISKPTVLKLLVDAGRAAGEFHNRTVRNLGCRYVEVDEIWTFVQMKQKRALREGKNGVGDVYTFTAVDAESKLVPTWLCGDRNTQTATRFLVDLSRRIPGHFQVTSDAASFYREAAEAAFGGQVDYAQIWKHSVPREEARNVPKIERTPIPLQGNPDPAHIGTTYVERQNLTMRSNMRRFTRKSNGFSKRKLNLACAVALYFFHYNFIRPHITLTENANGKPTTPAMMHGLFDRPLSFLDLVTLIEAREESARDVAKRRKDRRE